MGPYQPNSEYERTSGKTQTRGFVKSWFTQFDWLEYSPAKNAAYCFYRYLFKPPATSKFDNDALEWWTGHMAMKLQQDLVPMDDGSGEKKVRSRLMN